MASVFAHALSAFGISKVFPKWKMTRRVVLIGMVSAVMPDIDVASYSFGISSSDWLGHRGLTHSVLFAMLWAALLLFIFHRKEKQAGATFIFYVITTSSHGLLDAMTTGGRGVGFLIPLTDERWFLPWRSIQVSPIGASQFFSEWGLKVLANEAIYVGLPTLLLIALGYGLNKSVYKTTI